MKAWAVWLLTPLASCSHSLLSVLTPFGLPQETVDVMTAKNSALLAEKAMGQWVTVAGEGGDGDTASDMTGLIQGYLQEIEELRAKLCESEQVCQQLRKQANNRVNARTSMTPITMHAPMAGECSQMLVNNNSPFSPN